MSIISDLTRKEKKNITNLTKYIILIVLETEIYIYLLNLTFFRLVDCRRSKHGEGNAAIIIIQIYSLFLKRINHTK
jgi:hypothetical protein